MDIACMRAIFVEICTTMVGFCVQTSQMCHNYCNLRYFPPFKRKWNFATLPWVPTNKHFKCKRKPSLREDSAITNISSPSHSCLACFQDFKNLTSRKWKSKFAKSGFKEGTCFWTCLLNTLHNLLPEWFPSCSQQLEDELGNHLELDAS